MKKLLLTILLLFSSSALCAGKINFHPISHASLVITSSNYSIYVDPVGNKELYEKYPKPDLILITHHHHDHYSKKLIEELKTNKTTIIVTPTVKKMLSYGKVMENNQKRRLDKVTIESIPAYNTTPERLKYHTKGRDNGYVITLEGKRIYISGDTEDIKEMRSLKNIDHAFICMNLPFTMTVDQAVSAVLDFKPRHVYPYHYKGKNGKSDVAEFKKLVIENNKNITVKLLKWY